MFFLLSHVNYIVKRTILAKCSFLPMTEVNRMTGGGEGVDELIVVNMEWVVICQ